MHIYIYVCMSLKPQISTGKNVSPLGCDTKKMDIQWNLLVQSPPFSFVTVSKVLESKGRGVMILGGVQVYVYVNINIIYIYMCVCTAFLYIYIYMCVYVSRMCIYNRYLCHVIYVYSMYKYIYTHTDSSPKTHQHPAACPHSFYSNSKSSPTLIQKSKLKRGVS